VVVVQHPAKPFAALDATHHGGRASPIVDQLVVDPLMVALDGYELKEDRDSDSECKNRLPKHA
jgi:hypothetical protein